MMWHIQLEVCDDFKFILGRKFLKKLFHKLTYKINIDEDKSKNA